MEDTNNIRNILENCSLHEACENGQVEIVRELLKKGANPNLESEENGQIPLRISENNEIIQLLLSYGANPNIADHKGFFLLTWAALHMNIQKMTLLLNYGADPNATLTIKKHTPLQFVILNYYSKDQDVVLEGIKILTEFGANIDYQNLYDESALFIAVRGCYKGNGISTPDIVHKLLQLGANPNFVTSNGRIALHLAASKCIIHVMRLLLNHGADPNALENPRKYSALHEAFDSLKQDVQVHSRIEAFEILVQYGANINCEDDNGMTMLHKAVELNAYNDAKILMNLGSDPNIRDKYGRSALEMGLIRGCTVLIKLCALNIF